MMRSAFLALLVAGVMAGAVAVQADERISTLPGHLAGTELAPAASDEGELEGWWQVDGTLKRLDRNYQVIASTQLAAENLAVLLEPNGNLLLASMLGNEQRPTLLQWNGNTGVLESLAETDATDFLVEALCLQRDSLGNVYLFLIDERGRAEQWWLRDAKGDPARHKVRDRIVAPNGKACVADSQGHFYIVEEGMAVWQYSADPEAASGRELVDLVPPFGSLAGGTEALTRVGQTLIAVDVEHRRPRLYTRENDGWRVWPLDDGEQLAELKEPEQLHSWWDGQRLQLVLRDDDTGLHHQLGLPLPEHFPRAQLEPATPEVSLVTVKPRVQTESVARFGDAADDPAIWVHPEHPELSRVLGTDKKLGLDVFAMDGARIQHLATGRINNVDVRYGFDWDGETDDIAVATQRDNNTLSVYRIDSNTGELSHQAELPTGLDEIYGVCLYQSRSGETYAIANSKSGAFEQYQLAVMEGELRAILEREFAVETQPEGCVADDTRGELFVGEEDRGLWALPADPDAGLKMSLVLAVGDLLVADLEGVSLYPENDSRYLILSSQGDHSYVILDAKPPYRVRGKFQVAADADRGIDGISETDGLETTARPLGPQFAEGMLVVQDGHKVMPEAPQNFKYISWTDIAEALKLND